VTVTRADYHFSGEASIDSFTIHALPIIRFADNFEFLPELSCKYQDIDYVWSSSS